MGNATLGRNPPGTYVKTIGKRIDRTTITGTTLSLGWLPPYSAVVGSGISIFAAWNGTGNEECDLGFRNSVDGYTADPDAFSETAFDLDAAVGHTAGDVTQVANVFFKQPAEVTCTITNTDATAGEAFVYVQYIVFTDFEDLI